MRRFWAAKEGRKGMPLYVIMSFITYTERLKLHKNAIAVMCNFAGTTDVADPYLGANGRSNG